MTTVRERVIERFRDLYGRSPELVVRAPGRVNLLGAHVDYNEGWVLPGAIDRAIWLAGARGSRPLLRAASLELGSGGAVPLDRVPGPPGEGRAPAGWIDYAAGVAWALAGAGLAVAPLDAVIGSELPAGAGVSSSAALEVAFLLAWREIGGLALDDLAAARLGRRVENEYLGVQSGIMDQFASLHGGRDSVVFLDCRTLEWERLPMPPGVAVLVADSGVRRRLVDGPLNDRRGECVAALEHLREASPELGALRDVTPAMLEAAVTLPDVLRRRVRHVVEECARVRRGADLLRGRCDAGALGELVRDSHRSSRDLYQVSSPELDTLAEAAWSAPGCHGARLVGAGFGGCVAALVDEAAQGEVADAITRAFGARFGREPRFLDCRFGAGAGLA
ncbi:MAG TPA: galactokinase [Thermoanaerobaculia bacterium]|nr:galactokinase [Thermoanaerobaculia bacterium]